MQTQELYLGDIHFFDKELMVLCDLQMALLATPLGPLGIRFRHISRSADKWGDRHLIIIYIFFYTLVRIL